MDAHVILAGQSNALGFGNTGPAPYAITVRVQIWADTNGDGVGDAWNYMRPGVNTGTVANPGVWGAEVQLANRWLDDNSAGYLWIVKSAKGSTGLAQDAGLDWSPQSQGEMFDLTDAAVDAARANLIGTSYAFTSYDALFWAQGETDAADAGKAAAYQANLTSFLTEARTDWMNDPHGLVVMARVSGGAVHDAQVAVGKADRDALGFDTDAFTKQADGLHLAAAGQVQQGDAFYEGWVL